MVTFIDAMVSNKSCYRRYLSVNKQVSYLSASGLEAPNLPGAEAKDFLPSEKVEVAEDRLGVGEGGLAPDLRELVLPTCSEDLTWHFRLTQLL